jgi:hypothetical protein
MRYNQRFNVRGSPLIAIDLSKEILNRRIFSSSKTEVIFTPLDESALPRAFTEFERLEIILSLDGSKFLDPEN